MRSPPLETVPKLLKYYRTHINITQILWEKSIVNSLCWIRKLEMDVEDHYTQTIHWFFSFNSFRSRNTVVILTPQLSTNWTERGEVLLFPQWKSLVVGSLYIIDTSLPVVNSRCFVHMSLFLSSFSKLTTRNLCD